MTYRENRSSTFTEVDTTDVGEAMYKADHNFQVEMVPLTLPDGQVVYDKKAVIRTDTNKYLGTVGRGVHHIQPVRFYEMAGELIKSSGGRINKTITMGGGSVIGLSFQLAVREYVAGDVINLNFLMLTSFDSSYAILGRTLSDRLFCLNQLASSMKLFNIKNTKFNEPRLEMATKMLKYHGTELEHFDAKMKLLVDHRMSDARAIEWFGSLLPAPLKDNKRSASRWNNQVELFSELLEDGMGTDHPGVRGTAYGALNAHTEYCNHHRTTRVADGKSEEEVRFETTCLGGSADKMMQKGFESLVQIAHTVPSGSIV
jgi:phage/plasmid-like protein (TIGR03299 family)